MAYQHQCFAPIVIAILFLNPALATAQESERYDFDGVADSDPQPDDPTDWMTLENWSDSGADPFPPFGPPIPDFGTRVEIVTSEFGVNAPVIGPGDVAEAFGVRIGRTDGAGLLTMNGGTLNLVNSCSALPFSCNRRLRVGNGDKLSPQPGTFNLSDGIVTTDTLWIGSGSQGTMNMSGGEVNTRGDFSFDWSAAAGSVLNMTGGTINVGTDPFASQRYLRMYRNSALNLDGGEIFIPGFAGLGYSDGSVTETPNVIVNIDSGLLQAGGFLRVEGSVTVNGGILRADSFNETLSTGTVEINASGLLQFNHAEESVLAVEGLIVSGVITTSDAAGLLVEIVEVNGTDFTQVSILAAGIAGDFDGDGDVDGADFLVWQQGFANDFGADDLTDWENNIGTISAASTVGAVPEPSSASFALIAIGAMILARSRRMSTVCTKGDF